MLTIAAAKAATPRTRGYKLSDSHGLHLFVAPTGTKSWRQKYRFGGREKLLTFGRFPDLSLAEARQRSAAAKAQLQGGIDPGAAAIGIGFESVARAWHELQRPRWSPTHAGDVLSSLERDVFPKVGNKPITEIGAGELLAIVRQLERRACVATARRLRQRLSAVFRFAKSQELVTEDPASALDQAMLPAPLARPMAAIETIEQARALLNACDAAGGIASIRLAARFLALTAVRLGALRGADWIEFANLDGDAPTWTIPADRMKLSRAKKAEERFAHIVPLSRPAIACLEEARHFSRGPGLVFRGRDGASPIGAGAIGALIARAGFAGRHVPHGWRASFSTILNEELPSERDAIDKALAHAGMGKVEAAYNRSGQLDRRRALFDRWGALLTE